MVRMVVEDDASLRLAAVVLDPDYPEDGRRAFADFLAHDVPNFAGWLSALRKKIPGLFPATCVMVDTGEQLRFALADADCVIVEALRFGPEELAAASRLKLVQKFGGLTRNIDLEACARRNVVVSVQRRRVNAAVAEHGFTLMIALAKRLIELNGVVDEVGLRKAGFRPDPFDRRYTSNSNFARVPGLRTLNQSTLGVLGLGEVGREVASRARAFGMRTLYYQRTRLSAVEEDRLGVRYATMDELLRESDFVSIHLPITDGTRGLLNRDALARLKPGAILINVARAEIIDHEAVVEALESGHLGGFALDVGYQEPANADEPLKRFPNVILTPHTAPASRRNVLEDMEEMCLGMWTTLKGRK
jgi:phosphoglycerate dehydrogenase-like enzyme